MVPMVQIFKASKRELKKRDGYHAKYVADITFREEVLSAGFVVVKIPKSSRTKPHSHQILEEVFIIMDEARMGIDESQHELEADDVVLIEPGEIHWFEASKDKDLTLIAIKLPNLKEDKIDS